MTATNNASLFARLMVRAGMIVLLGAAVLVSGAWFYARAAADDAYDRILVGAAFQMVESLVITDGDMKIALPSSAFELLGLAGRDRIFYRVIGPSGATLTGYSDLHNDASFTESHAGPVLRDGTFHGADVRVVTVARAIADAGKSGWTYIILAQTTEARRNLISELTSRAILLVAVMSSLALAATALAARYSLKPLADLGVVLASRDPQDLTPLTVDVPREIAPFVTSINHFITRLDQRVKLLQRYVADSAHQIRTPLTALSAQVSLINEDNMSPEDRRHLERVRNRAIELGRFTNQLLNHAMVIHRFDSAQLSPMSLNDVARKAFRATVPITIDPDAVVSFEAPDEDLIVMADMLSLREAITNLIDNALKHGMQARLDVRVARHGDHAVVEVEDDGPGIPPEQWPQVTQRFVSHNKDGKTSGLGFAIASEVATALGGRIGFREKADGAGFTTWLELPLHDAGSA
ncbi:two-component system sensor histidine kinase TctE [Agrobacterium vitis]|nr:two-component system sensor histidine kinase TctE [Agrobacterium vitis]MBE1438763.1 two-component system sensor histidine kinase TctE [Agrobacterium vitis]